MKKGGGTGNLSLLKKFLSRNVFGEVFRKFFFYKTKKKKKPHKFFLFSKIKMGPQKKKTVKPKSLKKEK